MELTGINRIMVLMKKIFILAKLKFLKQMTIKRKQIENLLKMQDLKFIRKTETKLFTQNLILTISLMVGQIK